GRSKPDPRDNREPAEICIRVKQLMKGVDPSRAVILKAGILSESAMKIRNASLAFVKDRAAKKGVPFNVEHNFRQTLGLLKEFIRLKSRDRGQSIERIRFCDRNHVVRNRVDPEFALVKVLHHKRIAQLGNVDDTVNISGKFSAIYETRPISSGCRALGPPIGIIDVL